MAEHSHHESHDSHGHHGHSRKYHENREKYVYTTEELEAYRVTTGNRNVCVNLFVPYSECVRKLPVWTAYLDPKKGPCSQEVQDYEHCMKIYIKHQSNGHVRDSFYANGSQAKNEVLSPTYEQRFYKSPLAFTW